MIVGKRTPLPLTPTFIDRLLLVTHAVPDSALVIDCADCGADKFSMIGGQHDQSSSLTHWSHKPRARFSNLRANDMVMGTERKLREAVLETIERRGSSAVFLVQSSAVQLIGSDHETVARDIEEQTGVPVMVVPSKALSGDYLDGLAAGLELLAAKLPLAEPGGRAEAIGVVGSPFDRFEQDQAGNVRECARMLDGIGFAQRRMWLDGSDTKALGHVGEVGTLLALPLGRRAATKLASRAGARKVDAPALPIGIEASVSWVRAVSEALGCKERGEAFIERELDGLVPRLERAVHRTFMGRRAAVIGDPDFVAQMTGYLAELGVSSSVVAVLARREKALEEARRQVRAHGQEPIFLADPSFVDVEGPLRQRFANQEIDFIVGSGAARDAAKPDRIPYLEIGHPCYVRHALADAPFVGFRGAAWIADQLFNMLSEADYLAF